MGHVGHGSKSVTHCHLWPNAGKDGTATTFSNDADSRNGVHLGFVDNEGMKSFKKQFLGRE